MRELDLAELALIATAGCTVTTLLLQDGVLYIGAEEHDGLDY